MDIILYGMIAAMLLLYVWVDRYRNNKIGNIGENIVKNEMSKLPAEFTVTNNVKYKNCQIDHMVICHNKKIIFVIETKLWSGIITGDRNDKQWRVYKNGQVMYYNNPILQNEYHCRKVRQKYSEYSVYSIVVFVKCKSIPRHRCVMGEHDVVDYIIGTTNKIYNRRIIDI